jgi:viroplasmin and RNaseH domain-containing protein
MDSLTKLAHAAIKQLQAEKNEAVDQLSRTTEAVKVAFELYHNGQLSAEQLESKIKEFSGKPASEMEVIKKASELTKVASNMSSFRLSGNTSFEGATPEDRFTSFLLEDL